MTESKEFPKLAAFTEAVSAMQASGDEVLEGAAKLAETMKASQFPKVDLTRHLAVLGTAGRQAAAHQMEVDRLTMELVVCAGDHHEAALAEAERRRDLFTSTWSESSRTGARPDRAALKSVVDDLVTGRWLL